MSNRVKRSDMRRLADYREWLRKNPQLTYLFFELTDACNLSCLHCGSNACPENRTFLPLGSIKTVLKQVANAFDPQGIMICLSGGEPLLHPHFFEIAAYVGECGFPCGITTNGTCINPEVASKIVESGIRSVTISLDGMEDTHDWFRNKEGSFRKTVQGVRNLLTASNGKVLIQITTVVHRRNFHQLEELFEFVSGLGINSWRVINLEPIGRALDNRELLLDPGQFRALLTFIREKRYSSQIQMDITYGCSHYLTMEFERTVRDNYFLCGSGILVASILCNGDIYSCLDIERRPELVQGNINQDNFVDIWENGFQVFRRNRTLDSEMCRNCPDKAFCSADAGHTWDYDKNQPLLCVKKMLG